MAEKVTVADIFKGVKDFVQDMAPGLSAEKIGSDLAREVKQQTEHGAHELAAALFTGSSFVMYPRAGKENHDKGATVHGPDTPQQTPEVERDQDRGR